MNSLSQEEAWILRVLLEEAKRTKGDNEFIEENYLKLHTKLSHIIGVL